MKLCAAFHDLCSYSKSSLTVVIPVMEALGVEVCPFPTALLSTQTDGFSNVWSEDLSYATGEIIKTILNQGVKFDCIYSGYMGSSKQFSNLEKIICANPSALVVVDPVMGDNGALYPGQNPEVVDLMRSLIGKAKIITPNQTEAALLAGEPAKEPWSLEKTQSIVQKIKSYTNAEVVITSVNFGDSHSCNVFCDAFPSKVFSHKRVNSSYPGSGDLFASIMTAKLLNGSDLYSAVKEAALLVTSALEMTGAQAIERKHGICLQGLIPLLSKSINGA